MYTEVTEIVIEQIQKHNDIKSTRANRYARTLFKGMKINTKYEHNTRYKATDGIHKFEYIITEDGIVLKDYEKLAK